MNRPILIAILSASMLATGPLPAQDMPAASGAGARRDAALPPDLDRVLRDYERAWRAGDAESLASLFEEDGFVLQSNRPPVRGRAAIRAAYEGQGGGPLRLRAFAFGSADTIAYIVGGYGYGDKPGDVGKFTLTLRRAAGQPWLIYSDMDNANAAPPHRHAPDAPPSTEPAPAR